MDPAPRKKMNYEDTMAAVKVISGRSAIAVAVASAERVLPLLKHLGTPRTAALARRLVDLMWSAAHEGSTISSVEAGQLRNLDESHIDDSLHQLYYPMLALGVVDCALKATAMAKGALAEETCGSEVNLMQDVDYVVGGPESNVLGEKLLGEIAADLVQGQDMNGIQLVRARAESWAAALAGVLPAFAKATNNRFHE